MENTQKKAKTVLVHTISSKDLGVDLVSKPISSAGFSQWIRVLIQNWRQGTVASKGRSDVAYSNRKPWKQKGTGRARASSARSPLWRGGGVTFGPQKRIKTLKTSKRLRKHALYSLLADAIAKNKIVQLDWVLEGDRPKTNQAAQVLKKAGLTDKKVILFLPVDDMMSYASFSNLKNVRIVFFDQPNAFDLAKNDNWVVLKKDIDHFKKMVSQWI